MIRLGRFIIRKYWWVIVVLVICLAGQAYLQLMLPDYTGEITTLIADNINTPLEGAAHDAYAHDIWHAGMIMLILCAAIFALAITCTWLQSYVGSKYGAALRHVIYEKVMTFSLPEYQQYGMATLLTRTTSDVTTCKETFTMFIRQIIIAPVFFIVAIVKTINTNWQISLIFAAAVPVLVVFIVIIFTAVSPVFTKSRHAYDEVTSIYREGLTGVRVVRAFNQEEQEYQRFDEANSKFVAIDKHGDHIMTIVDPVMNVIVDVANVMIFVVSAILISGMSATIGQAGVIAGQITQITGYATHILNSLIMLSMLFIRMPRANICAKRVEKLLATVPMVQDPECPVDASLIEETGSLEFNNVSFTFPDSDTDTLHNISFKTRKGETTAIIGSTGSGKSTLINLIPRFYDVTGGSISIDGVDIRSYTQKDLRDKIGFIPQQALLFEGTIRDNVTFGNKTATDEEIEEALKVSQSYNFVMKKEGGIDARVSQGGKNFSGGQKQRLAIARAILKRSELYVFDDAFSALDFKTDTRVRTALKTYIKDASILIVAQRVSTILTADNIVVLNEGELVAQGKHAELYESCPVYREIVNSQMDPSEIKKTLSLNKEYAMEGGE